MIECIESPSPQKENAPINGKTNTYTHLTSHERKNDNDKINQIYRENMLQI